MNDAKSVYDDNDSVTTKSNSTGVINYLYNTANKLSGMTTVGSGVTNYFQYSDSGVRVRTW